MKEALTPKQLKFLQFINDFQEATGLAPSQRELAQKLGFRSVGTVQRYKTRLEGEGLICVSSSQRGLELTSQGKNCLETILSKRSSSSQLPLLGKVAAGQPIEAIETYETIEVPQQMIGQGQHFALKIQGDSMIEECIRDGDYVIIRKQKTADNGQIIVALIDNEATIKTFYKKNGRIELHPANPQYDIIHVPPTSHFQVEGLLRGVIRCLMKN